MTKTPDLTAASELHLFAVNDADLYRQRIVPIMDNLARKIAAGTFDAALSIKLWSYAADDAAKRYTTQHGGAFSPATRRACAALMADYYADDVAERGATLKAERDNRRVWTIAAIRQANYRVGYFFNRDTMRGFGDTVSCFAPRFEGSTIFVERVKSGSKMPALCNVGKRWTFNPETGSIG